MNCTDIATIIDEHRDARLAHAERGAVDAHLLGCADCSAAWHAHAELLALTVPAAAPALLDRVLVAVTARARPRRRASHVALIGVALVAGAALAAITVTRLPQRQAERAHRPPAAAQAAPTGSPAASAISATASPAPRSDGKPQVDTSAIALDIVAVVRTPPVYPPDALKRGVEGSVTLKFDVTARGVVENASVMASTDDVFDEAALNALTQWRYFPRIADGKRVASRDVQTIIRFQLEKPGNAPPLVPTPAPTEDAYLTADPQTFTAALIVALDRTGADDFRGAELELDELRARYTLSGFQEGTVWDVYAYLYLAQGNYDRAIEAYGSGIAAYARSGVPSQSALALARLYFARHQYEEALRTLLKYKELVANTPILAGRPNPIVDGFIERLRALGVTEESLLPRR
jgi:TonB family protein